MEKLGIEPIMLLTQVINFGIIVFILAKFLYKPILTMIEKRKKEIDEGLTLAAQMKVQEEELVREKEKVIEKARLEGQKIINESKSQARVLEEQMLAEAAEEAKIIKEKGKKDVEEEKKRLLEGVGQEVLTVATAIAKAAVADALSDEKAQMAIIQKKVEKFTKEKINV